MKLIATTALAVLLTCPAFAAPNCAATADVESVITQKFGEEEIASGMDNRGRLVQWWGNLETGTWTATITSGGQTCIVSEGGLLQRMALKPNV